MARKRVQLDWSAGDRADDDAESSGPAEVTTIWRDEDERGARFGAVIVLLCSIIAALTCVASGPFSLVRWLQENAQRGIQQTMALQEAAQLQRNRAMLDALVDPNVAPELREQLLQEWPMYKGDAQSPPQAQVANVRVLGDIALAEKQFTVQTSASQPFTYLQHLFFRNVNGRWLYTRPNEALWGAKQTLATQHMRFEFGELDREVVLAAAPRIDAAYAAVFALLGAAPPTAPMHITVMPYPPSTNSPTPDERLVSSPLTANGFPAMSAEDMFVTLVMMELIPPVVNQLHTPSRWTPGAPWNAVSGGFQSWLMQEVTGQPHPWKQFTEPELKRVRQTQSTLRLADLSNPAGIANSDEWLWRQGAAELMLAYTDARFGRAKLNEMVQNLAQYNTWDYVIPTVLGVSVTEFEAGWNQYAQ
ncbi:MAG: hypothetical protein R3A44_20010 [Caldilineaceae bacterium]